MEKKEDKKAKFLRIYANVPENLRGDIVTVIDGKPYTWNTSFLEIRENTELGKEILISLEEVGVL